MNEQNDPQKNKTIQGFKNIWIIIIVSVIIIALVVGGLYTWQRSVFKATEQSPQKQIDTLQKQVKSSKQGQLVSDNSLGQDTESKTQISGDKYKVLLKENSQDSNKTDIYLKNLDNNAETFFMTIADVYLQNYHSSEYYNGNLYIIRRIGYDGSLDETWSDELWRYNSQKIGTKLYSAKGLDFRVNVDESLIAIITNKEFILLNNRGKMLKSFQSAEVIANPEESPMFGFLAWGQNSIWLDNTFDSRLVGLVKIDTKTYAITKYNLTGLSVGPEFAINVYSEKLAFSNYPVLFDVDNAEEYKKSNAKVNLKVYNLKTKKQQLVSTSITKRFAPKWIDKNTLEYNDPSSNARIQKIIE